MNVVPLKKYVYDDWLRIATQNNALRVEKGQLQYYDVWPLWRQIFPA